MMVHRCVTGQALLTVYGVPLAVYELADRIGVAFPPQFKDRQRQYGERLRREKIKEWFP